MKVTRDVVTDLLPLYLSGDVSDDTRQLVDVLYNLIPSSLSLRKACHRRLEMDVLPSVKQTWSFKRSRERKG